MTLTTVIKMSQKTGRPFRRPVHLYWIFVGSKGILCASDDKKQISFRAESIIAEDWELMSIPEWSEYSDADRWLEQVLNKDDVA
jgi:hypothetical protein